MNNNDCEFVYSIERKIREDEEAFIYTIIEPFSETIVEKKLSKAELKQILEKGMQKSIPLDKVKQAREEIKQNAYPIVHGVNNHDMGMTLDGIFQVLDKLIESEEE